LRLRTTNRVRAPESSDGLIDALAIGSRSQVEMMTHGSDPTEQLERLAAAVGDLRDRVGAIERDVAGSRLHTLAEQSARSAALAGPTLGDMGLVPGRRARHGSTPGASRAICSLAVGSYLDLLPVSGASFLEYGRRWGWDVVLSAEDLADGRADPWGKVRLVRELLDDYEFVLWLDADAIFVDARADVAEEVVEGCDLYLVEHRWGDPPSAMPNAGVMLFRSTPWSRSFLERMWACEHRAFHAWSDNAALVELLGYELEPVQLVRPTADLERVRFLPLAWNSISVSESARPFVKHYAGQGLPVAELREHLLDDLAMLRRGSSARPMPGYRSPDGRPAIQSLSELPGFLAGLGLLGCGVVLDLGDGARAEQLLAGWHGLTLISIAPPADGTGDDAGGRPRRWAEARLAKFGTRSEIWAATTREAAVRLPSGSVDFVFVDPRSGVRSMRDELALWWGKLRPGGVMVGSDYVDEELHGGVVGARAAVDAFCEAQGLPVWVLADQSPPAWLVRRELA
jgi:hypothetical protein